MCGIELWDQVFNGALKPNYIPRDEWAYSVLRCKNGRFIELPRYHRDYKSICMKYRKGGCENCIGSLICPLIQYCQGENGKLIDCKIVENQVYQMINQGIRYNSFEKSTYLTEYLWEKSSFGIRLIQEILDLPKRSPNRIKYYKFFGFKTTEGGNGITSTSINVRNVDEKKIIEKFSKQLKYTKIIVNLKQEPC